MVVRSKHSAQLLGSTWNDSRFFFSFWIRSILWLFFFFRTVSRAIPDAYCCFCLCSFWIWVYLLLWMLSIYMLVCVCAQICSWKLWVLPTPTRAHLCIVVLLYKLLFNRIIKCLLSLFPFFFFSKCTYRAHHNENKQCYCMRHAFFFFLCLKDQRLPWLFFFSSLLFPSARFHNLKVASASRCVDWYVHIGLLLFFFLGYFYYCSGSFFPFFFVGQRRGAFFLWFVLT